MFFSSYETVMQRQTSATNSPQQSRRSVQQRIVQALAAEQVGEELTETAEVGSAGGDSGSLKGSSTKTGQQQQQMKQHTLQVGSPENRPSLSPTPSDASMNVHDTEKAAMFEGIDFGDSVSHTQPLNCCQRMG